jgi:outer membrane protein
VLEDMPAALGDNPQPFLDGSLHDRPDLTGLRLRRDSANKFAEAEKDLSRPTISALGVAGASPAHAEQITSRYAAAGVNVSIPIFNGGLFKARHDEATLRAQALDESVRALEDQVTRDVRVAWLDARTGLQRMQTSAELQKQAALSLDLAQARYDLGLSTIVELNQSLLNKTSADLAVASARFDYQLERTVLDFQTGSLR